MISGGIIIRKTTNKKANEKRAFTKIDFTQFSKTFFVGFTHIT